jgi:hypothetical protein
VNHSDHPTSPIAILSFDVSSGHVTRRAQVPIHCSATIERRDRLQAHIEAALPDWSLAPVVRAPQALRGMALAAALTAELGDIIRFANPRPLMAYRGLVLSEHSIGGTRRQGGITKPANGAARRRLIDAAWSCRFPARISQELLSRQEGLPKGIGGYRGLAQVGNLSTVVTAAIAGELSGLGWSIARLVNQANGCHAHQDNTREDDCPDGAAHGPGAGGAISAANPVLAALVDRARIANPALSANNAAITRGQTAHC